MRVLSILAALLAIGLATPAIAADEDKATDKDRATAGQLDDKTTGANIRASKLIGMNVYNDSGKGIGEVNDVVLDGNTGKIRYAALSYGGFLGLGDKMFAVPWEAFRISRVENDDEYILVLSATEAQMKAARGFDDDHWPDFGDVKFTEGLDKHYGIHRDRDVDIDVKVNRRGVDVDVDRTKPDTPKPNATKANGAKANNN